MGRVICFDIETTGLEYMRGDRCIEIGAVEMIDGNITDNTFHEYINPDGKIIPPDSYMVHKISNAFLEDKPKMAAVAPRFLEFIGDSPIVAHNGLDFDFPFINHELQLVGLPQIPREQQFDSIVIARNRVFGPKSYSLDALAKWYGISLTARADAHGALIDAEILAKVYKELENTAPAPDVADIIAKQHADFLAHPKIGANFPHRQFPAHADELDAHNAFMEKITA
ncbi:MAG TPA: ribonuclease H-like domain-containing protein [Candidatus Enterousia intestinigallinarum]|uniref:DNA-directed DNA polymerase n=1 Tax=Candidatus Enterousia intestinigallinarum TaxID=2840790 RepID=A0A9D1FF25_9PROT|nr:ribonuclease H-like domain-containing protein [Candidatus Enterousia intestinigallinarum]